MNWYLAKLIFDIDTGASASKAQFDEQLRLVNAVSETDAYFKAKELGRKNQSEFLNEKTETVAWRFVGVSEVVQLNEIKDGVELYSTTLETNEKENFINSVLQKGIAIQSKNLLFC
ncbi:MAG: DUF4288 domain-containing protein [Bacteroidetes bacterium]|nr:DUF4288 domain-containing protein [Bacteroidota bacterium]